MSDSKKNLETLKNRASNENEMLLITILLELQEMQEQTESSVSSIKSIPESLEKAGKEYIDILDKYNEDKKSELTGYFNLQMSQIIMATNELKEAMKDFNETIKTQKKSSFFGFRKK